MSPSARLYCDNEVRERWHGIEGKDQLGRRHCPGKEDRDENVHVCGRNGESSHCPEAQEPAEREGLDGRLWLN